MSRGGRVRGLALAALGALAIGACGTDGAGTEGITEGGTVIGRTLTVLSLLPSPADPDGPARDVVDGERLALAQAQGRAGELAVTFGSIDETGAAPADELDGQVASATRRAIADPQAVAVIGDLDERTARITVPLLNAAGTLHVSPGVSYPGFTSRVEPGEPERWYPAGPRTFFPLVPDDRAQAQALAGVLRGRVLVEQEESASGRAFGAALRAALGRDRLAGSPRAADAAVYAGTDPESAREVVEGIGREAPRLTTYLPVALSETAVARRPRVAALTAEADPSPAFARAFREAFGRRPTRAAVTGHRAMRLVLDAIRRTGADGTRRSAVIDAFERGRPAPPALRLSRSGGPARPLGG